MCLPAGTSVPVQAQKKYPAPPKPTVAPFDAKQAEEQQKAWAKHLAVRVKTRISFGVDLMLIPPGEFLMGSPAFEEGRQGDVHSAQGDSDKVILYGRHGSLAVPFCLHPSEEFEQVQSRQAPG
jgi:hypothetical protein